MAITETSTAYASPIKYLPTGTFVHAFAYTVVATASASANALVVLGPKVQNQLFIVNLQGYHTSGADSCPVDIGIDANLSVFASQKTQGVNLAPANMVAGVLPYKVSVSDDAAALYSIVKFGVTAGTNTTGIILKYAVTLAADIQ